MRENVTAKVRLTGKLARRNLSDAIAWYISEHSDDLSDNQKTWLYRNATEKVYITALGKSSIKLRKELETEDIRSQLTYEQLGRVEMFERLTAALIVDRNLHPFKAVEEAKMRLVL